MEYQYVDLNVVLAMRLCGDEQLKGFGLSLLKGI